MGGVWHTLDLTSLVEVSLTDRGDNRAERGDNQAERGNKRAKRGDSLTEREDNLVWAHPTNNPQCSYRCYTRPTTHSAIIVSAHDQLPTVPLSFLHMTNYPQCRYRFCIRWREYNTTYGWSIDRSPLVPLVDQFSLVTLVKRFPLCYPSIHRSANPAHALVAHIVPQSRPVCVATGFVIQIVAIQTLVLLRIVTQIVMIMFCPYSWGPSHDQRLITHNYTVPYNH